MLFTSDIYTPITPDNQRLRRFKKIELEPAESKTIEFELTARNLAFYNYNNQFVTENGDFIFRIDKFEETVHLSKSIAFDEPSKLRL